MDRSCAGRIFGSLYALLGDAAGGPCKSALDYVWAVIEVHKIELARIVVQFQRRLTTPPAPEDVDVVRLAARTHADILSTLCLRAKENLARLQAQGKLTDPETPTTPATAARNNF